MDSITLNCYAKVNLTLDILGKREDGYHEIRTVMQSVDIKDILEICKTNGSGIELKTNLGYLPKDSSNIAYKAAEVFLEECKISGQGISIRLDKNIPVAAGMAGGSSNGAGVLVGLNRLLGEPVAKDRLLEMGASLGSDVPFSMTGGTMLSTGRGDCISRVDPLCDCYFLIVKPRFSVSTRDVYKNLNVKKIFGHPDTEGTLAALANKNLRGVTQRMYNVLQEVTEKMHHEISEIQHRILRLGALGSIMSGSGPTVFGVFETEEQKDKCLREFGDEYDTFFVKNKNCGVEIVQ